MWGELGAAVDVESPLGRWSCKEMVQAAGDQELYVGVAEGPRGRQMAGKVAL